MGTRLPRGGGAGAGGGQVGLHRPRRPLRALGPGGRGEVVVSDASHARYQVTETILEGKATEVAYWVLRTAALAQRDGGDRASASGARSRTRRSRPARSAASPACRATPSRWSRTSPAWPGRPSAPGQLVVRGGNPRDTRVYVDGLPVPAVFHFGGLTSIYSSELLKEVEFQAGNFGASQRARHRRPGQPRHPRPGRADPRRRRREPVPGHRALARGGRPRRTWGWPSPRAAPTPTS